jgi:hypothetical protein
VDRSFGPAEFPLPGLRISPDPVNGVARISLKGQAGELAGASLRIFDVRGRMVTDLSGCIENGSASWNAEKVPAGIYLVTWTTSQGVFSRKCLVSR